MDVQEIGFYSLMKQTHCSVSFLARLTTDFDLIDLTCLSINSKFVFEICAKEDLDVKNKTSIGIVLIEMHVILGPNFMIYVKLNRLSKKLVW